MKSSILLQRKHTLSDAAYGRYIYDSILCYYKAAGYQVETTWPKGKNKLKAGDAGVLWVLDAPEGGWLKQSLWQKFTWPKIVRDLAPELIYLIGPGLPVLHKANTRQWLFITQTEALALSQDQSKKALTRRRAVLNNIRLASQSFLYAPVVAERIGQLAMKDQSKFPDPPGNINVWTPFPTTGKGALDWDAREIVKTKYSQGHEYFLVDGSHGDQQTIMHYLKAFSHFKKWQKSSMQLLILVSEDLAVCPAFQEMIGSYYFRKDVQLMQRPSPEMLYELIASSYAVLDPEGREDQLVLLLAAAQYGTLAVSVATPAVTELLGDALFVIPGTSVSEIGQIMMAIYKSEILRSKYIKAGLEKARLFKPLDLSYWLGDGI